MPDLFDVIAFIMYIAFILSPLIVIGYFLWDFLAPSTFWEKLAWLVTTIIIYLGVMKTIIEIFKKVFE